MSQMAVKVKAKPQNNEDITQQCCIISGEPFGRHQLIRFVADENGTVFPDIGHKVEGQGVYVQADRAILEQAIESGQLVTYLKAEHIAGDMASIVDTLLVKSCQSHISMANRSGIAIGGGGKIRACGTVAGLLIADDASTREARALRGDVSHDWIISVMGSHEIGRPFGRQALAFAAILPESGRWGGQQSEKLSRALRRLATYRHKRPKKSGKAG